MATSIKIVALLIFISIMVAINMGVKEFGKWAGPDVGASHALAHRGSLSRTPRPMKVGFARAIPVVAATG